MNISGLQTFLAVVETGNLNKAATRLNVTQSTVTARLDALEDVLGQSLLVRARRGAQLTKAGFAFQRHAELMVQAWDQAQKEVGLPSGFSGLFSFACHGDLWEGAGESWLGAVRSDRPELALEAWPGTPGEISGWLASGLVDAALVPEPMTGPGLASRAIGRERLVQVSTTARSVQAWDSAYIYVDLGAEFRRQHALTWRGGETPQMTYGSSRWALDDLLKRGGSAYLPWRLVASLVEQGRLSPITGAPEFSRALHLAWRETSLAAYPWITDEAYWPTADL